MTQITVGMIVYNGAGYLDETLASLCAQSFPDFTLLISDNASTDATPDILAEWAKKDSRIKIVRQPENIGAVKNFEYVLEHADSEWFMCAAHDDKWSPNYVEALYKTAVENPESNLIVPRVTLTQQDGSVYRSFPIPDHVFDQHGLKRIRLLLHHAHGSWFYGLHRTENFRKIYEPSKSFGHIWGIDMVILAPYLLSGKISANDDAVFSHLETGITWEKYKPRKLKDQWGIYRAFWREVFTALNDAPLTRWQKLALLPALVRYVDRHSCKFRRIVKSAVLYPFRKG